MKPKPESPYMSSRRYALSFITNNSIKYTFNVLVWGVHF